MTTRGDLCLTRGSIIYRYRGGRGLLGRTSGVDAIHHFLPLLAMAGAGYVSITLGQKSLRHVHRELFNKMSIKSKLFRKIIGLIFIYLFFLN
jgi:hypothetical protein